MFSTPNRTDVIKDRKEQKRGNTINELCRKELREKAYGQAGKTSCTRLKAAPVGKVEGA